MVSLKYPSHAADNNLMSACKECNYVPLPGSYAMLAGMQEMQAKLSQADLGASLSKAIPLWCFFCVSHSYWLPPGMCRPCVWAATATGMPSALTHHPGCMLPKLWHPPWSHCVADIPRGLVLATTLHVGMLLSFLTTSPSLQYGADTDRAKHVHINNRMRLSDCHVKPGHKWGL